MLRALGSGIDEEEVSLLGDMMEAVVVKHMAVGGCNRREGQHGVLGLVRYFQDGCSDLRFVHARLDHPVCL